MIRNLLCGAHAVEITPHDSQFLFGYPHVDRYSTGVHDPLFSSALYLNDGATELVFVTNDIIFVDKALVARARDRVSARTGLDPRRILISATHTHSGPITVDYVSNEGDPAVPRGDPDYLAQLEEGIVEAAIMAHRRAVPAELGLAVADGSAVGTNRRDPRGPSDPEVPVLLATAAAAGNPIGCMVVCSMHPTVLHEDSLLVSADFPGAVRSHLQSTALGSGCPLLYHTGPCGNQSPRHVTRANTFAEAERLGRRLGASIRDSLSRIEPLKDAGLAFQRALVDLPRRQFPGVSEAEARLARARERFEAAVTSGRPPQEVRTAEVDWFGAEETLVLAKAAADGRLEPVYGSCLPAEVQVLAVGPWAFVGWPGEVFVEYGLDVKRARENVYVISLANGELQGYIVTEEAALEGGYEASNSLFSHRAGRILVETTLRLLDALPSTDPQSGARSKVKRRAGAGSRPASTVP